MLHLKNEDGLQLQPGQKILKAADYSALLKAEGIVNAAKEEAAHIAKEAQLAFEAEKKRGFAEGLEAGNEKVAEHMLNAVNKTVKNLEAFESQLIEIVMQALKRIIGEIDDKKLVNKVVKQALTLVRNEQRVTLKLSASDIKNVQESVDALLKEFPGIGYIDLVSDDRIEPGSCMLETDIGVVDARIDKQLEAIRKSLTKSIK